MGQTFVYNHGKDDLKKEDMQLTFGVFIDGTLYNKDNTDMRNKQVRVAEVNIQNEFTFINYDRYNKIYNK